MDFLGESKSPFTFTGKISKLFSGVYFTKYSKPAVLKNVKLDFYGYCLNEFNPTGAALSIEHYDHHIENMEFCGSFPKSIQV